MLLPQSPHRISLSNQHLHFCIDFISTHNLSSYVPVKGLDYFKSLLSGFPTCFLKDRLQETFLKYSLFRSFCLADFFSYHSVSVTFLAPLFPFPSDSILTFFWYLTAPRLLSLVSFLCISSTMAVTWYYFIIVLIFANIWWFLILQNTTLLREEWRKPHRISSIWFLPAEYKISIQHL